MTTKTSRAMKWAHYLYKNDLAERTCCMTYDPALEWKKALKKAWYFVRFQEELSRSVIRFSFYKVNGEIREALGTRNLLFVPEDLTPKHSLEYKSMFLNTVVFFDLQKHEWRSFNIRSFIGFVDIWRITHIDKPVLKREK